MEKESEAKSTNTKYFMDSGERKLTEDGEIDLLDFFFLLRERERREGTMGDGRKADNGTILVIFNFLLYFFYLFYYLNIYTLIG